MPSTRETMGIRREVAAPFEATLARVPEALKSEGFGILTEIDVKATLKQKLGVELRNYRILGACNPPFAHQALERNLEAGLMLPCNVVVFEDDNGHTVVLAVDPTKSLGVQGDQRLVGLAEAVREKLARAIDKI